MLLVLAVAVSSSAATAAPALAQSLPAVGATDLRIIGPSSVGDGTIVQVKQNGVWSTRVWSPATLQRFTESMGGVLHYGNHAGQPTTIQPTRAKTLTTRLDRLKSSSGRALRGVRHAAAKARGLRIQDFSKLTKFTAGSVAFTVAWELGWGSVVDQLWGQDVPERVNGFSSFEFTPVNKGHVLQTGAGQAVAPMDGFSVTVTGTDPNYATNGRSYTSAKPGMTCSLNDHWAPPGTYPILQMTPTGDLAFSGTSQCSWVGTAYFLPGDLKSVPIDTATFPHTAQKPIPTVTEPNLGAQLLDACTEEEADGSPNAAYDPQLAALCSWVAAQPEAVEDPADRPTDLTSRVVADCRMLAYADCASALEAQSLVPLRTDLMVPEPTAGPNVAVRTVPRQGELVEEGATVQVITNPEWAADPTSPTPGGTPAPEATPDPNRPAPAPDSRCGPAIPALDFNPLSQQGLGDRFPFGIFGWVAGTLGGWTGSGTAPAVSIPMPGSIEDLHIDTAPVMDPIMGYVRPVVLIISAIGLMWMLASSAVGLGRPGGDD